MCTCLCVIYKGCNQRCHNVSVPAGEVPHCLSGDATSHRVKHTHTHAQQVRLESSYPWVMVRKRSLQRRTALEESVRLHSVITQYLYISHRCIYLFITITFNFASKYIFFWMWCLTCVCAFSSSGQIGEKLSHLLWDVGRSPSEREALTVSAGGWDLLLSESGAHRNTTYSPLNTYTHSTQTRSGHCDQFFRCMNKWDVSFWKLWH